MMDTFGGRLLQLGISLGLGLGLVCVEPALARAAPAVALPHYNLVVNLDQTAASLDAREVVQFTNELGVALDQLVFKTPAGAVTNLSVSNVLVDGQPVAWTFDASRSVLDLDLNSSVGPGRTTSVELDWSLQIPRERGRLSAADDVVSLGSWLPLLAVHHGDWDRRPYTDIGDPFFTEVADYDLELHLATPATVAFSGDLVRQDCTTWQIAARSVRDLAVAVSPDYQRLDAQIEGGPHVSVYALDAGRAQAELDAARTYLEAYAPLVGPYPLTTLRVAETGLQPAFAGMEYPGLVFISTALAPRASAARVHGVVAHEVAHQWFYGWLGDDEIADPWLDEAFATYLASEASELEPQQLSGTAGNSLSATPSGPAVDGGVFDFSTNGDYGTAVYARGAGFLDVLRKQMGDPGWISFLRALYATYAGKVETPRAVLDLAQQFAPSTDLSPLINTYTSYFGGTAISTSAWTVRSPSGPWSGQVAIDVESAFAIGSVEVWLDDRQVAGGSTGGTFSIDTSPVPAGDYVLLVRLTDLRGVGFERASRVSIEA